MNAPTEVRNAQIMSQWIVSLAVSVVCCAVLFLVFARYIIEVHSDTSLALVRTDVLEERQNRLITELDQMRHPMPVIVTNGTVMPNEAAPATAPLPALAPTGPKP